MTITVFAGPDPEANLNALIGRTPLRSGPFCAVSPDSRSVTELERTLARSLGDAFLGSRVLTMEGLARSVASLGGPVPEIIGPHVRRALAGELALKRIGAHSRFAGLAAYPGFIDLLVSWLEDSRCGDEIGTPDTELDRIATAYDIHLKRLGLTDHEGLITHALGSGCAGDFSRTVKGTFIIDGFYDLTVNQLRLLESIFTNVRRVAATLLYDSARPGLFGLPGRLLAWYKELGARIVETEPRPLPGTDAIFLGFKGGKHADNSDPSNVQVHTFRGEESEADWVAGTIRENLAAGIWNPGEVMVVSRFRTGFGSPLHTALRRNGIPVEGGMPRPLAHHPVVRFALTAIDASIHPNDEELAVAVRRSSYAVGFEPGEAAGEFDDRAWNCMVEVGSPWDFVLSVRKMLELLGVKDHLNGGGDPDAASLEVAAHTRFQEILDEFAALYTPFRRMMQAAEFSRLLGRFMRNVTLADASSPGKGALVTDVTRARQISRPVVFFVGLDNTSFPAGMNGFSLHETGFALKKRSHAELEEPLLFYASMQGARHLYFTFPGIDDDGRDHAMSPYLREILEKNENRLRATFHHGVAGSAWAGGCSTRLGQAESILRMMKREMKGASEILATVEAWDARLAGKIKKALSRYIDIEGNRGCCLTTTESLETIRREWGCSRVYGVTDLETYVACPLRFYFARLLRLKVDRKIWGELDPADLGVMIHDILARFYRKRLENGNAGFARGDIGRCREEMQEACEQVFAEMPSVFEGLHPVAMLAEKKFIFSWMEQLLEREADYFDENKFRPEFLEVDFGYARDGRQPPFPPLHLGEGEDAFRVGGRIDRIDVDRSGHQPVFRIIDYKSGERKAALKNLETGRDLQLPLYLKAVAESILPGCAIRDGIFYSLRELDFSHYRLNRGPLAGEAWDLYLAIACEKAAEAVKGIRSGDFPAGECVRREYCDYLSLCRGGRENREEAPDADS